VDCPACGRTLSRKTVGGLQVDVCDGGCGGIWFDQFELKKVDEPAESAGEELLDVGRDASVTMDLDARRTCPKCADRPVMLRHFTSVKRRVTIDECPECGGVWLDAGELGGIRSEFGSEAERHAAAEAYFSELFDGPLAAEHAETEAGLARARKIASALRFVCPSYYMPGKQDWGAF
jgi:Zn-finger nucleic acid-binding protein